jgi:ABC-type glycerol-3-phosphate transport system substrate-binding protein
LTALKDITAYAEEGPTSYEQNEVRAIFLDGKLGMIQASVGAKNLLKDAKFKWGVTKLPQGPSAKGPGTLLITDSLAVFKGTGVEEKAIDLAKFLTNPENQPTYEAQEGLTPLRPGPAVDKLVADDPNWKPFIDGIAFGGPEPLFTDYKGLQNTMIEMVQSVVTGAGRACRCPEEGGRRTRAVQISLHANCPRAATNRAIGGTAVPPIRSLHRTMVFSVCLPDRPVSGGRDGVISWASSSFPT